jgi:hypothetical protein
VVYVESWGKINNEFLADLNDRILTTKFRGAVKEGGRERFDMGAKLVYPDINVELK